MALKIDEQFDAHGNLLNGYAANQSAQTQVAIPNTGNRYSDISDDTELEITEKKFKVGKKYFGDNKTNGIIMGIDERDNNFPKCEFGNSDNTRHFKWTGKGLDILNENLSIDEEGNLGVSSLRRNDFHWFTLFESLDGFTSSGSDAPTLSVSGVSLTTGATSGDDSEFRKTSAYFKGFTWGKKRSITTSILIDADFSGGQQTFVFGAGIMETANVRKIGFWFDDENVYGIMGDGTSQETTLLGTITTLNLIGQVGKFQVDFDPAAGATFYINDVQKGSVLSTNIPSGGTGASRILDFDLQTDENVAKECVIGYYDFWQAL